ncbi:Cell division membrane protein FtsW [Ignavibacterium album JCM 16511]|uniref:Probable peptidoglycan glycosyltransferase FtsW n=1 Tax=Ignavibacterium album (strain DSM 19864 / JCM 16511 / NBRC 101810 / Mat9-16) TaxID=945713 RepID=I0ALQ3_IGNAJ|nr:FtsW/RodA/SpoVE family cell cycle protein [Ignavibacterium album]AFH49910.1 Cell division membrane protein FtsW [Ignavibacterium album JCM 16511]
MKKLALTVFFDTLLLICLGLIIVLTASSTISAIKFSNSLYLFNSHLIRVLIALVAMIGFSFIPYEIYKSVSKPLILFAVGLLIFTLLFAPEIKGAGRWLSIAGITFQPADIAKFLLIIHLSAMLEKKSDYLYDFRNAFVPMFIWVVGIAGLILIQPNISNGLLIIAIALTMMFVGGIHFKHIFLSSATMALSGGAIAMIFSHSRQRILSFINSIINGGDMNLQVKQALVSLGSGGLLGVGIGNSKQNNLFLPEAYGDFIFAILGEQLGFIGSVAVILFYLVLFIAGILIAKKAQDKFGQLLAFGITFSIAIYAFVNIAVATGTFPTTGLPLPFISYGGTSIIFLSMGIGILINIAIMNSKKSKVVENDLSDKKISEK